jgi:hypothetical protein
MWHRSGFVAASFGGALAVACILLGLEVSATTAVLSTTAVPSVEQAAPKVNRTLKSDRLPLAPGGSRNLWKGPAEFKLPPAAKPELLIGCEPIVSAIGQPPLARIAGRCVS